MDEFLQQVKMAMETQMNCEVSIENEDTLVVMFGGVKYELDCVEI